MTRENERTKLITEQLAARGVKDARVLRAMGSVPREEFVIPAFQDLAYGDCPLPIAHGQTISQPYIVAFMLQAAQIDHNSKVLEIGTGSGYAAAVTSLLAKRVISIEIVPELATEAAAKLLRLGYNNVSVNISDGTLGWAQEAPYDAIIVTAGGTAVPRCLKEQLTVGGRLVIPVGPLRDSQDMMRIVKKADNDFNEDTFFPCAFVPLVGRDDAL